MHLFSAELWKGHIPTTLSGAVSYANDSAQPALYPDSSLSFFVR